MRQAYCYLVINFAVIFISLFGCNISNQKSSEILNRKLHYYASLIDTNAKCLFTNHTIDAPHHQLYVKLDFSFSSGLGNILFPFAAAHDIALNYNKTFLKIRGQNTVLEWFTFDVDCKEYFRDEVKPAGDLFNVGDNGNPYRYTPLKISPTLNYKVHGLLQSYKYFDSERGRLFMYKGLKIRPPLATEVEEFMQAFKYKVGSNAEIVCAHIRLGDKLNNFREHDGKRKDSGVHWVADESYLKLSIQWFDDRLLRKNVYILFTDSLHLIKDWSISQYTNQSVTYAGDYFNISHHNSSLMEFEILLNHCDHHLLTSGTYGWWAGWKSKGLVLFSELQYVHDNKNEWDVVTQNDHFPPNFHLVYPCSDNIDHYCGIREPRDLRWNDWKDRL